MIFNLELGYNDFKMLQTSPYEWKILEWDDKPQSQNKQIQNVTYILIRQILKDTG